MPVRLARKLVAQFANRLVVGSVTDQTKQGRRLAPRDAPPCLDEPVDVLVPLEDADKEKARILRERSGRTRCERLEIRVGRKGGIRFGAELSRHLRRERTDRAHPVRVTDRRSRGGVGKRGEEPSGRSAVQARRGARITMEFEDDARTLAHEHPCNQDTEGLVRALSDDGFRLEAAELAPDAERKPR